MCSIILPDQLADQRKQICGQRPCLWTVRRSASARRGCLGLVSRDQRAVGSVRRRTVRRAPTEVRVPDTRHVGRSDGVEVAEPVDVLAATVGEADGLGLAARTKELVDTADPMLGRAVARAPAGLDAPLRGAAVG